MSWSDVFLDPTILLTTCVIFLVIILWRSTQRLPGSPPGPGLALPLLGHSYLLLSNDLRTLFSKYRKQYGDIFSLFRGTKLVVVLNGYETIKEALIKHADVFSNRPPAEDLILVNMTPCRGVIISSGELWKALRKTSLEILRELGLGKNILAEKIQEEVNEYVKELASQGDKPINLAEMTQISVSNNICSITLGKRFRYEDDEFKKNIKAMDEIVARAGSLSVINTFPILRFVPGDPFKIRHLMNLRMMTLNCFIKPFIDRHIRDYGKNEARDFISAYIRDILTGKKQAVSAYVNEVNLKEVCNDLFVAGTETTSTTIRWCIAYFLHHPDVQGKCFQEVERVIGTDRSPSMRDRPEMTYVEATIMETLRYANIVPLSLPHCTSQDVTFQGYRIHKNTVVIVNLDSILHDPNIWGDPEKFRPERFIKSDGSLDRPEEFVPFSLGRRVCLGEALARMELFLYLTTMIQRFKFLPPEDGELPSLEGILGVTYMPPNYRVRIVPRN